MHSFYYFKLFTVTTHTLYIRLASYTRILSSYHYIRCDLSVNDASLMLASSQLIASVIKLSASMVATSG